MATPSEKLAESLEILHRLQNANGAAAIRARDITRTHRERLLKHGFLQEVIKGWYITSRPDEVKGESTAWYASSGILPPLTSRRVSARTGAYRRSNRCPFTLGTGRFPGNSPCGPLAFIDNHHAILPGDKQTVIGWIGHDVVPAPVAAQSIGVGHVV